MDGLVESLMEELNCNVVFTIPIFGGIDVYESVVVTWIIMGIIMVATLILVHGLKVRHINNKQAALELSLIHICSYLILYSQEDRGPERDGQCAALDDRIASGGSEGFIGQGVSS